MTPRPVSTGTFENGLRYLILQDTRLVEATMAMVVRTGSYADPIGYEGLSHFVEHAMFLGSKRYPAPHALDEWLQSIGGSLEAFTEDFTTSYAISYPAIHQIEAASRLADLIVAPCFDREALQKERHVLHAEYLQFQEQDEFRIDHILSVETATPHHPLARFKNGSLHTLRDHDELSLTAATEDFYHAHYGAKQTTLVVISPDDPTAILSSLAPFHALHQGVQAPLPESFRLSDEVLRRRIRIQSLAEYYELRLQFRLTGSSNVERQVLLSLVCFALSLETPGGFIERLTKKNMLLNFSIYDEILGPHEQALNISLELSIDAYERCDYITGLFFDWVNTLQHRGWYTQFIDAIIAHDGREQSFPTEPDGITSAIDWAKRLHEIAGLDVLSSDWISKDNAPSHHDFLVILKQLAPKHLRQIIISPMENGLKKDPYYQTSFSLESLDTRRVRPRLHRFLLPTFSSLGVAGTPLIQDIPDRVLEIEEAGLKVYVRQVYNIPYGQEVLGFFKLEWQSFRDHPASQVFLDVFAQTILRILSQHRDQWMLWGIHQELNTLPDGLMIEYHGFSDRFGVFVKHLFDAIDAPQLEDFAPAALEEVRRQYELQCYSTVHECLEDELDALLYSSLWSPEQLLHTELSLSDFQDWRQQFRSHMHVTWYSVGDQPIEQAKRWVTLFSKPEGTRGRSGMPPYYHRLRLPEKKRYWVQHEVDMQGHGLVCWVQLPPSVQHEALLSLSIPLLDPYLFHHLRTESHIGYTVYTELKLPHFFGFSVVLESPDVSPSKLYVHYQDVMQAFIEALPSMESSWTRARASWLAMMQRPVRSLGCHYERDVDALIAHAAPRRLDQLIDAVQNLQWQDALPWMQRFMIPAHATMLVCASSETVFPLDWKFTLGRTGMGFKRKLLQLSDIA